MTVDLRTGERMWYSITSSEEFLSYLLVLKTPSFWEGSLICSGQRGCVVKNVTVSKCHEDPAFDYPDNMASTQLSCHKCRSPQRDWLLGRRGSKSRILLPGLPKGYESWLGFQQMLHLSQVSILSVTRINKLWTWLGIHDEEPWIQCLWLWRSISKFLWLPLLLLSSSSHLFPLLLWYFH